MEILVPVGDRLDEEAFVRLSEHQRGTGVSAREEFLDVIDLEGTFHLFRPGAVAGIAFFGENGPDFLLKKSQRRRRVGEAPAGGATGDEEKRE